MTTIRKVCKVCEKVFYVQPIERRRAYCSQECRQPSVTCKGCGKTYVPSPATRGTYCSMDCMKAYLGNQVEKQCPQCEKVFSVKASKAAKYNYCSLECKKAASYQVTVLCKQCNKPFMVNPARKDKAHYCSYDCNYADHREIIQCAYCGKERTLEKHIVTAGAKCCSNKCATLLRMRDGFEPGSFGKKRQSGYHTDIETMTENALVALGIPFIFEHKVGRYSIDFALPTYGIALECDGWQHMTVKGREHDRVRDQDLTNKGWKVIHMTDKAIRTDAYSAVTNALKGHFPITTLLDLM